MKNEPTAEQLDYLAWYEGNVDNDYPSYDTDAYGRVKHPGWQSEVSLESLTESVQDGEDDDDKLVVGDLVRSGNVPSPDFALAEYRDQACMDRFSEREKDVLILTYVCLMWPREIAEYLGISVKTVKEFQQRAKRKIAKGV